MSIYDRSHVIDPVRGIFRGVWIGEHTAKWAFEHSRFIALHNEYASSSSTDYVKPEHFYQEGRFYYKKDDERGDGPFDNRTKHTLQGVWAYPELAVENLRLDREGEMPWHCVARLKPTHKPGDNLTISTFNGPCYRNADELQRSLSVFVGRTIEEGVWKAPGFLSPQEVNRRQGAFLDWLQANKKASFDDATVYDLDKASSGPFGWLNDGTSIFVAQAEEFECNIWFAFTTSGLLSHGRRLVGAKVDWDNLPIQVKEFWLPNYACTPLLDKISIGNWSLRDNKPKEV